MEFSGNKNHGASMGRALEGSSVVLGHQAARPFRSSKAGGALSA